MSCHNSNRLLAGPKVIAKSENPAVSEFGRTSIWLAE